MKYPLYNDKLAPIWNINEDGALLDPEVRKQLLKIAIDFVKELKENNDIKIKIEDVVLIGSLTNYNWTPYSDVDLHIVTDYKNLDMSKEDAQTLFDAIKASWNNKHDITMKGHDVELYIQDIDHKSTSASKYSVLRNEWIKEPVKESPNFNKELIKKKYKEYKNKIDSLVKGDSEKPLKDLLDKLYKFRQAGLDKGGELSEENVVFKILRTNGYLDKLKGGIANIYDKKMSIKEIAVKTNYDFAIEHFARAIHEYTLKYNIDPMREIKSILPKLSELFGVDSHTISLDIRRELHKLKNIK